MVSKKPLSKTENMPCIIAIKQVTAAKKDLKRAKNDYFKATKARSDAMNKYLAARKAQSLARRKGRGAYIALQKAKLRKKRICGW